MNNCPCYGCKIRNGPCHDTCELYKEWKAEAFPEKKPGYGAAVSFTYDAINRQKQRIRAKK